MNWIVSPSPWFMQSRMVFPARGSAVPQGLGKPLRSEVLRPPPPFVFRPAALPIPGEKPKRRDARVRLGQGPPSVPGHGGSRSSASSSLPWSRKACPGCCALPAKSGFSSRPGGSPKTPKPQNPKTPAKNIVPLHKFL